MLCPVTALCRLFTANPQPPKAPFFRLGNSFSRNAVVNKMRRRIVDNGISQSGFTSHSFRKGTAQHAADHGMLNENIQRLERWISNAFQLYFKSYTSLLFAFNLNLSKRRPVSSLLGFSHSHNHNLFISHTLHSFGHLWAIRDVKTVGSQLEITLSGLLYYLKSAPRAFFFRGWTKKPGPASRFSDPPLIVSSSIIAMK